MKKGVGFYFMVLGLVIGIFSMSFFISYDRAINQTIFSKMDTADYLKYKVLSKNKLKHLEEKLKSEDAGVILENGMESLNFNVLGMNEKSLNQYNIKTEENMITVGKGLRKVVYSKSGKEYMKINDKEYEILEYIEEDTFAYTVILNIEDFFEIYSEKEIYTLGINFVEKNIDKEVFDKKLNSFKLEGIGTSECEIDLIEDESKEEIGSYIGSVILAISFINVCTFSLMWITGRTKELALYKAIGAKNRAIFLMLFKEILEIAIVSMGIALGLQLVVNSIINNSNIINSYLSIDIYNLIKCSFIILFMALGSIIPSYIITTNIQPSIVLKED
ncbi:MAG: FtsX-like permease family protein [Clostridium sp.]|uniref:FtsX-like permease family protein n=1 Tax=Clostridium sp. TaxID=1506 RepID=UPI003F2A5B10